MAHFPHCDPETTDGDDEAAQFVTLLMEHRHRIYAFVAKQLVNPADAEDVFQKTSMVLWKKMSQFDRRGSFFHWACGVAFNEVLNFLTARRRTRLHFDSDLVQLLAEEARQEDALSEARLGALRRCMAGLSDRQRGILRRCYAGGETVTEIARNLDRNRDALYKQLARLREKLLDCIRLHLEREGINR